MTAKTKTKTQIAQEVSAALGHASRDKRSGRYSYEGQWDRVCVCGGRLGDHTAEPPHELDDNDCPRFRLKNSLDVKGKR